MVDITWDQPCTALEPYGVPAIRGTYGYYTIRGSWRQPYGYAWDIHRNTYAIYLQDSWTINGKLTLNAGLRTESEYIPTFNPERSRSVQEAHQVRLRRQAGPPLRRRL